MSVLRDDPEELLVAADVARLSGHPSEAVQPLQRVVSAHRRNARAPLAAFTLGRVYLEDLGRPREAAQAFAEVGAVAPTGPLTEDALAREVESWSRAGELARAHDRGAAFLAKYPASARASSVKRFAKLP